MNEWYLIVIVSMQMNGDVRDLKLNEFHRPTQEQCAQELPVFEEHYSTQLGKQIIDRLHMYGRTWYMHKKMISGEMVGFTIKCESRDNTTPIDQPKILPWIW